MADSPNGGQRWYRCPLLRNFQDTMLWCYTSQKYISTIVVYSFHIKKIADKTLLERANYENPIISISTASNVSIGFNLTVDTVDEFFVEPSKYYQLQVTPSQPK